MRTAIVLRPDHLYGPVILQRDAYGVGADLKAVPQTSLSEAHVFTFSEYLLVAHGLENIHDTVSQDHEIACVLDYLKNAAHYRQSRVYQYPVSGVYALEYRRINIPALAPGWIHPGLTALFP